MTASSGLGTWLRAEREQRLWTRTDLARRIIQAARDHGDTTMPALGHLTHNLYRWERGANGISDRYRLYCADILGTPPAHPGTPARPAPANEKARPGTPIVITIILPDGIDARVKITRPGDPPPEVPGTAR